MSFRLQRLPVAKVRARTMSISISKYAVAGNVLYTSYLHYKYPNGRHTWTNLHATVEFKMLWKNAMYHMGHLNVSQNLMVSL